jgi:hypothetical protein
MALNEKDSEVKKKQPHEMTNAEYVSKLMGNCSENHASVLFETVLTSFAAATPSYFFTPTSLPQAGHNFFFSELLRSLVQKRKAEELNLAAMKAKCLTKKVRKPVFQQPEQDYKKPKLADDTVSKVTIQDDQENSQDSVINVDKDDPPSSAPTTATTSLQQPLTPALGQSAFYPYVDPLHFFIDLRVSAGQIYDRKKEAYLQQALSTWSHNNPMIGKSRNSAFKVPEQQNQSFNAMNLISNQQSGEPARGYQKMYKTTRSDEDEDDTPMECKKNEDIQIFDLDKTERN